MNGVSDESVKTPDYMSLAARFTLPWSAYVRLLSLKTGAAREFYETEALCQGWSVRQLDRQIRNLSAVPRGHGRHLRP